MPFLVVIIVLSLSFYIYYKVKYVRSSLPMERKTLSGKSSIALGLFVGLFGVNQLFLYHSTTTYIVAALFIIVGALSIWAGFKSYRFYLPYAIKEMEEVEKQG
ncbi:YtpI family protein [Falsibacillus pallidus]|uniref:YtpI-like protein n=1 Tax=Falsibacillus pallidus TaxID=493781 RepID=A0A370GKR2_9BACI|nr:YtpI family protein [Falsibacillus pallidus]RDI44261.1 YtpI-like protein [Falsibacillus pallidus]